MAVSYNSAAVPVNRPKLKYDKIGFFVLLLALAAGHDIAPFLGSNHRAKGNPIFTKFRRISFRPSSILKTLPTAFKAINFGTLFLNTMIITILR